jgi:subtilisin family serine protease
LVESRNSETSSFAKLSQIINASGSLLDSSLQNYTQLLENGYLQEGMIRVVVLPQQETQDSIASSTRELDALSEAVHRLGGFVTATYSDLPFVGVEVPYNQLQKLAAHNLVNQVFLDEKYHIQLSTSVPIIKPISGWNATENQFGFSINGTGVRIAILDTGIDFNHPDFYFPNGTSKIVASADFTGTDPSALDDNGHGTHCASISAGTGAASNYTYVGVAPGSILLNGKVLDNSGSGYSTWVISGIEWAVSNGANIISMSFAANINNDGTDALSLAVDWAVGQGATCAVAAGNIGYSGQFTVGIPAGSRNAITVGATTRSDQVAGWSSLGPTSDYRLKPDVCAPGENIIAARANGTSMGTPVNNYYTCASGTSMAAPHVAGAAALLLQAHPDWNPARIKSTLMGTAKTLNSGLWAQGAGRIDVCAAVNTHLMMIEPSSSFGIIDTADVINQTLILMNLADTPTPVTVSTSLFHGATEIDCVTVNATSTVIPAHGNTSILLQVGPLGTLAAEGWYEGKVNIAGAEGGILSPYLFAVCRRVTNPQWGEATTLDLGYACRTPHRLLIDGGYLYAGGWDIPGKLAKIDMATFNVVANLTLPAGEDKVNSLLIVGNYLYAGLATSPGEIVKVDLANFTEVATLDLDSCNVLALVADDHYIYASLSQSPGMIQRVDLVSFTIAGTLNFELDENFAQALAISDGYLYAGTWNVWGTDYCRILKINLTNFRVDAKLNLQHNEIYPVQLAAANGSLYAGLRGVTLPAEIVRIDFATFTEVNAVSLSTDERQLSSFVVCGGNIYAGLATNPGKLVELTLSPLVKVATFSLKPGENQVVGVAATNKSVYAGLYTGLAPGKIVETTLTMPTHTLNVLSAVGGTTDPPAGNYTCEDGNVTSITASPDAVHQFDHWLLDGANVGSGIPINITMNDDHTVQAAFSEINYSLIILPSTGGSTSPSSGTWLYLSGSPAQVTANPSSGYVFDHWVLDDLGVGSNATTTVQMDGNHTLEAVFVHQWQLTVAASIGGTTDPTTGNYTYTEGTTKQVTAKPNTNYLFDHWELDSANAGTTNPYTVTMSCNHTLNAVFRQLVYQLTISVGVGGTTNPTAGVYSYVNGSVAQVTAIPNTNYLFNNWILDGSSAGSTNPISILIDTNHSLEAVFIETHTLTIAASGNGTTNPPPGTYTYGVPTNVTVTAIPNANYCFDHWVYDGNNRGSNNPITVNVGSNHTLSPFFAIISYTLQIETTTGGATTPTPGTYPYNTGTILQVTATPETGYTFDYWLLDENNVGPTNPYTVTMNNNYVLRAVFKLSPQAPSVSISPFSATTVIGGLVTFTSTVSEGTPPYTYKWYRNGTAVSGATSSSWAFTPAATGYYLIHLNVTDNSGQTAKSNVASVTVNPSLAVLIQPTSNTITLGRSVEFTSTVSGGTSPYGYQWYLNNTGVPGANSPAFNFTPTSTGYYLVSLKVTDGAFVVATSNEAELTVNPRTYALTITTNAGGTTNPSPATYTYTEGTNVQVTTIPNTNYKSAYWELDGSNVGSDNPITVLMNSNHTLKAYFTLITYSLTITTTTGGTPIPAPGTYTYPSGSYASVTAFPSANYLFNNWILDSSPAGSANPISVLMNSNHTLQAVFSIINYALTITASEGGTTTPPPGTSVYASGSYAQATAIPSANYKFIKWLLDSNDSGSANPISVLMNSNHTLQAVFQLLTY